VIDTLLIKPSLTFAGLALGFAVIVITVIFTMARCDLLKNLNFLLNLREHGKGRVNLKLVRVLVLVWITVVVLGYGNKNTPNGKKGYLLLL
jgi:hypothetical protein